MEGGGEVKVPCVCRCSACARVLAALCCALLAASRIHMPTQGHNATGYTRAYDSVRVVVAQRALSCVCALCALCGCVHAECKHTFSRKGKLTRPSASSGAHRPRPSLRERLRAAWPTLSTRPHSCLPLSTTSRAGGGVSLRSRSACAAQQGRPTPSSPEENKLRRKEKLRSGMPLPVGSETPRSDPLGTHRSTRKYAHHVLITWHSTNSGAPRDAHPSRRHTEQRQAGLRQDLLREREPHHEGGGQWRVPECRP